jgi:hypothetical protein
MLPIFEALGNGIWEYPAPREAQKMGSKNVRGVQSNLMKYITQTSTGLH